MKIVYSIFTLLFFISCQSFYISLESLKQQYSNIDSSSLREVVVQAPYHKLKYLANPLRKIKCVDKKGYEYILDMSPSLEMEVTDVHGWHIGFYVDRTIIINNNLIGGQSRVATALGAEIPLDSIVSIKIREGGKNYYYLKR